MNTNPYEILHLPEDATYQEIKQRYRHLTINLHPDKQPLANYQLAHKHFKEIDEAYKSISSQLRRFVFKQFGPPGIILMSMYPYLFKEFQEKDIVNEHKVQQEVKQLVLYLIHEQHASVESQQKNLRIMSIIILYWPLNKEKYIPDLERCDFQYQMPLPPLYGFTQNLKISHSSRGLGGLSKSSLQFGFGMTKRIRNSILLMNNFGLSADGLDIGLGANWVVNQKMQVLLNLINLKIKNGNVSFGSPQVGVNFYKQDKYFVAKTDMHETTFEIGTTANQKEGKKYIKFGFDEDGAAKMTPTFEKQVTKDVRFFIQYDMFLKNNGFANSFFYGFRLKTAKQTGMFFEVASYFDFSQNSRLQLSLITPKYKATFPILSKTSYVQFQIFKFGVFALIYFIFETYKKIESKTKKGKNKLLHENYNRLLNDKNTVNKMNTEIQLPASLSLEKQIQLQGLIIIGAYYGQKQKIKKVSKMYDTYVSTFKEQNGDNGKFSVENFKFFTQKQKDFIDKQEDQFTEQLYQITNIVQANVLGAQLRKLRIDQLNVNPCIDQFQGPQTLIVYWIRGSFHSKIFHHKQQIKIGEIDYSKKHPWHLRLKNKVTGLIERWESMINSI